MGNLVCRLLKQGELSVESEPLGPLGATSIMVDMKRGGICGSDIHYYQDGGIGTIQVTEPVILGHEISGVVAQMGSAVSGFEVGDRVAINPSQPCFECSYCKDGLHQHCSNMRFMGSAKTTPHVQGGFREQFIVEASQCYRIRDEVGFGEAACAEPLAVCLHAARQAGDLKGKRVLVTGAGPIGSLCVAVASQAEASRVVVTDLTDFTLDIARQMGADKAINVATSPTALAEDVAQNGFFDVVFECSAASPAIKTAIEHVKPRGTIVQVGVIGEVNIPLNMLVGKEIEFKGSMRFHSEFAEAVEHINNLTIDVSPLITQTMRLNEAEEALCMAANRSKAMKVQLQLGQ